MLAIISPAKKQDFIHQHPDCDFHKPRLQDEICTLINELKKYKPTHLEKLMSISPQLATKNHQRFQDFEPETYNLNNAKQAIFAFQGDVYKGIEAESLNYDAICFLQKHLVILSGLYGILQPLDLIQPYRLEMKTPLKVANAKDLYAFWDLKITNSINQILNQHEHEYVVNLSSNEYFKAVKPKHLDANLINVCFKEKKAGAYKTIAIHAKRARGMMVRYMALNQTTRPEQLKDFTDGGYRFMKKLSSDSEIVFVR